MRSKSLDQWLEWQEKLHFTEIDPGIERISAVWEKMRAGEPLPFKVITVAGTNGKGSSVAMIDSILRSAGIKTGTYTSPHLMRYNERICINGLPCDDITICDAFERIDSTREAISLTYFEFATLAAMTIFCDQKIDIAILEVGMGGRLDAVNAFDADIALITPIGLDHTAWLGTTIDAIGFEKAGIMRPQHPVVSSEVAPPASIINHAANIQAPLYHAGRDFKTEIKKNHWSWTNGTKTYDALPFPALAGSYQIQNAAAVIQLMTLLSQTSTVIPEDAIKKGLLSVTLAGRFQQIPGDVELVFDVTHNQQGAENLSKLLKEKEVSGRTIAVIAMLKDKDIDSVVTALKDDIAQWYCGGLSGARGMPSEAIYHQLCTKVSAGSAYRADTASQAYDAAFSHAEKGDRILIFGSFHTVEEVMRHVGM